MSYFVGSSNANTYRGASVYPSATVTSPEVRPSTTVTSSNPQSSSARKAAAQAAWEAQQRAEHAEAVRIAQESIAKNNYNNTMRLLNEQYGQGRQIVNRAADSALGDTYVEKQLAQRNLAQQLAATGRSGGAAQSTQRELDNGYAAARSGLEEARADQMRALAQAYESGMYQARDKMNDLLRQFSAEYDNTVSPGSGDAQGAMASLLASGHSALSSLANQAKQQLANAQSAIEKAAQNTEKNKASATRASVLRRLYGEEDGDLSFH